MFQRQEFLFAKNLFHKIILFQSFWGAYIAALYKQSQCRQILAKQNVSIDF